MGWAIIDTAQGQHSGFLFLPTAHVKERKSDILHISAASENFSSVSQLHETNKIMSTLYLMCSKAPSFLCHFLQKEPIGFYLKTRYWLVHMVYWLLNGSTSIYEKNWNLITHLWRAELGSCDRQQPRRVSSTMSLEHKEPKQWQWFNSTTRASIGQTFSPLTSTSPLCQISHKYLPHSLTETLPSLLPAR